MSEPLLATAGIASGVVNTIGLIPYIRDIFLHKTKPERATWWVWFVLAVLALYAQWQAGATWSLGITVANILGCGLIAVLSLKYGYGKFHARDTISLVAAGVGVGIAHYIQSPLFALLIIVGVDLAGFWLTLYKSWVAPHTETLVSWVLAVVASALALAAVGDWNLARLIYPLYLFAGNILLVVLIIYRRKAVPPQSATIAV